MRGSRQINFFIVQEDWPAISAFFKQQGVVFIKVPILSEENIYSDDIGSKTKEESYQVYLTRKEYHSNVFTAQLKSEKAAYIDIVRSYAIEFNRGGFYPYSKNILHRARLYSINKYYNNEGHLIEKESHFLQWVDTLYKLFKKEFLKKSVIDKDFWLSENAIRWVEENKGKVDVSGLQVVAE